MLSEPQRIEVLESYVGEMEVELSHIRAQIKLRMEMMQQALQAKTADGDQHEDKSGGSGRGDANDDSGGAGRAPRKEGAAGARVGATTATNAGEECPTTAVERRMDQYLPTTRAGGQRIRLAWAR